MDNHMLSQEEIDALLNMNSQTQEELDFDALGEIGNIAMGSAATTLSTLLQDKVSITVPTVRHTTARDLENIYPLPFVAVEVEYTRGLQGKNVLVIEENDAKIISNLMMGGDGTALPDTLDEMCLSAVAEAMNQMMGSAATSMSTVFEYAVQISPPVAYHMDLKRVDFQSIFDFDAGMLSISFKMKVGSLIDSTIMLLLTPDFAGKMVRRLKSTMDHAKNDAGSVAGAGGYNPPKKPACTKAAIPPSGATGAKATQTYSHQRQAYQQEKEKETRSKASIEPVTVRQVQFSELSDDNHKVNTNIDFILDVPLQLTVELGRTRKTVGDILEMGSGTVIELDKLAGEPVDLLVNGKLIAKGEVVVIDENFAVRVTDIISVVDRVHKLQ